MLKVTFTESGEKLTLRLEGHARYAEPGKDIVCASATVLAYTLAQFVTGAEKEGDLKAPPQIQLDSGDTIISCEPIEAVLNEMQNMYLFAKVGYALLEHNYPQYVKLML